MNLLQKPFEIAFEMQNYEKHLRFNSPTISHARRVAPPSRSGRSSLRGDFTIDSDSNSRVHLTGKKVSKRRDVVLIESQFAALSTRASHFSGPFNTTL